MPITVVYAENSEIITQPLNSRVLTNLIRERNFSSYTMNQLQNMNITQEAMRKQK